MNFCILQKAFDALLPNETIDAVRKTCIHIAIERCGSKTEEWRSVNLVGIGKNQTRRCLNISIMLLNHIFL